VLLALWGLWWVVSIRNDTLLFGRSTWALPMPWLGGDFRFNLDHIARVKALGLNPYRQRNDLFCALAPYPPMVYRLFRWVSLFDPDTALRVWLGALVTTLAVGLVAVKAARRRLGLQPIPVALLTVLLVLSTPAVLVMERGQCDPLVIPAVIAGAALLNRRKQGPELAAGLLLGLTAWLKYYPGMTVFGLIALKRWRAAAVFVVVVASVGIVDRKDIQRSMANGAVLARQTQEASARYCFPTKHAIAESWPALWSGTRWHRVGRIPGPLVAAVLLLPAVISVSRRIARAGDPAPFLVPYMLWLVAAATFGMPYAIDYNLVPLALAALSVWDRRDRATVHVAMALLMLWWQPLALPIDGKALFLIKLGGLYAVGASLAARAGEREPVAEQINDATSQRPTGRRLHSRSPQSALSRVAGR
jgi:hypothetical protein